METNPLETKIDDHSFAAFLDQIQSKPPGFISDGDSMPLVENKNNPPASLKKEKPEVAKSNEEEEESFEPENEDNHFESLIKKTDTKPAESKNETLSNGQDSPFMNSFLIELVNSIKNTLSSIYNATVLTMDKFDDADIRKRSHNQVKEDIRSIDSVLNSLLNFININTPLARTNTLFVILEEILEANEKSLREKNIKIIKRFEEDLPDTYIHNEQIRFIFHSILQYAIVSSPPNDSITLVMKSRDVDNGMETPKTSSGRKGGYVEVMIGFNGDRKLSNPSKNLSGELLGNQREAIDLIIILVKEILQKHRGMMMIQNTEKKPKTLITLRFPIERRNVVYYAPINI